MSNRFIEVLPATRLIEIEDDNGTRVVEVDTRIIEIVEVGRLVINQVGGATFEHHQSTAASTWIIAHALGRRPAVSIYLSTGEAVETDVIATDTTVNITFPTPYSGWAVLN